MPTVTYRTPDGQTVTSDLKDAPPQIQSLYNQNYSQVQSQTQTSSQQAEQSGLNTQYLEAPQTLKADLQSGMTLGDAMTKYKALKMNPDDIFSQYVSSNTFGPNKTSKYPVESYPQLKAMGVSDKILGNVGDFGSPADKWNTKNALDELRLAKQYFQKMKASDIAGNVAEVNKYSKAYENARLIAGEHLSSLVPGASGAQATGQSFLNTLPSSKDIRSFSPGMIDSAFNSDENMLLAQKGYKHEDLGLTPPAESKDNQDKQTSTGGSLLTKLLTGANSDIKGLKAMSDSGSLAGLLTNPDARQVVSNAVLHPVTTAKGMGSGILNTLGIKSDVDSKGDMSVNVPKSGDELLSNILENAQNHPVNTALAVLGPILGMGGEAAGGAEAGIAETAAEQAATKAPGKLSTLLNPSAAKSTVGNIRDTLINGADKSGATIKGQDLANSIRQWADQAKLSNLPDADAIEQAAINAAKHYAGKVFKPSDLKGIYDNIETGYTKGSTPKSSTASYIDRGVQGVIADQLEKVAPGFQKTSELFSKVYNSEKSTAGKIVKSLPQNAIRTGLNVGGLGILAKLLGI